MWLDSYDSISSRQNAKGSSNKGHHELPTVTAFIPT